ncbi:MAG: ABC transporter ATP-binding protein [Marinosulfonomonas sp.]|nr:ABC transporter ATP-binding protein [Marinosulfonomonas sp.]
MIEIDKISVAYEKGTDVLQGVSLSLSAGEMVAVLGANGAGKSTLLRALSGLIPVRQGRIRFNGEDITRLPPHKRVAHGLVHVPEMRQMLVGLSVEENLILGAYVKRRDSAYIARKLETVYDMFPILKDRRAQLAGSLSGGQQQMVAIGRALMGEPKVLMCDEPSLGLAPKIVTEIFETLGKLRDGGVPVLLVEQNARQALRISDRAIVLKRGRSVLQGKASEMQSNQDVRAAYLGITEPAQEG